MRFPNHFHVSLVSTLFFCFMGSASADEAAPTASEVETMLRKEPFSKETWPVWRKRLMDWAKNRTKNTDKAFEESRSWIRKQSVVTDADAKPPADLINDSYAWFTLGRQIIGDKNEHKENGAAGVQAKYRLVEQLMRQSIRLDAGFPNAHSWLAVALLSQDASAIKGPVLPVVHAPPFPSRLFEAENELATVKTLDPNQPVKWTCAMAAMETDRSDIVETLWRAALDEDPQDSSNARGLAVSILMNKGRKSGTYATPIKELAARFPDDLVMQCIYAAALAADDNPRAAYDELQKVRKRGGKPEELMSPKMVEAIEAVGGPSWWEKWLKIMGWFAAFYAAVMIAMVVVGLILGQFTSGRGALNLIKDDEDMELVDEGQVAMTSHETTLAKLYGLGLVAGLVLFYLAIPFILLGLVGGTLVALYFIFQAGRVPIKLILIIILVGGGGVYAVFKGLFAKPPKGGFGVRKGRKDCPKLFAVLEEVADRVDTDPVDQVFISPGASIGVHQEGRGPFGVFGVSKRVLTLGISTMHFLTVDELKAILAHEYGHFSHKDTFFSRFIYQVSLSISETMGAMAATGGNVTYVNPFFWFLWLYHKSYSILSAGHSRSREFLADRMASSLYGADVFSSALRKVSTEGTLFETTIYDNIRSLLRQRRAFVNMYESFRDFRDKQMDEAEHKKFVKQVLSEKGSIFSSHPTFSERMDAIAEFPHARRRDLQPAMQLFDNAEELEKEMTDFLTGLMQHIMELEKMAAAQG